MCVDRRLSCTMKLIILQTQQTLQTGRNGRGQGQRGNGVFDVEQLETCSASQKVQHIQYAAHKTYSIKYTTHTVHSTQYSFVHTGRLSGNSLSALSRESVMISCHDFLFVKKFTS